MKAQQTGIDRLVDEAFDKVEKKAQLPPKNADVEEINPPVLRRVLGDSPTARILDFLCLYGTFDYSLTEIARNSGVGWKTLHSVWPRLERYGIVTMTREIGRAKMYRMNPDSKIAKALNLLNLDIAFYDAISWNIKLGKVSNLAMI
jgi:hypothetical protein